MPRLETWKQDQPDQQLVVLCQSVQGDLNNLRSGIIPDERIPIVLDRVMSTMDQIMSLREWVHTDWKSPIE